MQAEGSQGCYHSHLPQAVHPGTDLGLERPGFKSRFHHRRLVQPWPGRLVSSVPRFPVGTVGVMLPYLTGVREELRYSGSRANT